MRTVGRINRGQQVTFDYVNHRGEYETRHVTVDGFDYVKNDYYPLGALCLTGTDKARKATRSFDVTKISDFKLDGRKQ